MEKLVLESDLHATIYNYRFYSRSYTNHRKLTMVLQLRRVVHLDTDPLDGSLIDLTTGNHSILIHYCKAVSWTYPTQFDNTTEKETSKKMIIPNLL